MSLKGLPEKIYIAAYKEWKSSYQLQLIVYGYREKKITEYLFKYSEKGYFDHLNRKWRATTKGLIEEISRYIPLNKDELKSLDSLINDDSFRNKIDYHREKSPTLLKILNVIQATASIIDKVQTKGWMNNIQPNKQEVEKVKTKFNQKLNSYGYKKIDWNNISPQLLIWTMNFYNIKPNTIKKLKTLPQHQCSQDLIFCARSAVPIQE